MSDWFQDPHTEQNTNQTPDGNVPQQPEMPSQPETPPQPQANGWSSTGAFSDPVTPPTPPTPPAYTPSGDNGQTGWSTGGNGSSGNTGNTGWGGSQPGWSSGNGWQQPPQAPYGGWQQPQNQKPPRRRHGGLIALVASLAAVAVICVSASVMLINRPSSNGGNTDRTPGSSTTTPSDSTNKNGPTIATEDPKEEGLSSRDIVAANVDSTVIIRMYDSASSSSVFFQSEEETKQGEATGIVWTADGYIITNAHCVYSEDNRRTFDRIEVELYDGTVFDKATIVGYDTATDLAVIRVDATNLTPASFGDSNALAMGDRVIALGNNSGLGWSVTQGVVSGLARDVYEETNYAIKCLQVDAVINPGNSGGPLLNSSGQVIGINSAKIVAEGYEGLGFSIPINEARSILEDLVNYGYVKGRIMLGIEGKTFNRYSGYEGFVITAIGSPSSFSGTSAQVGDIITHVDGTRVKSYAEMREQLTKHQVGDQVTITLIRIGRNSRTVDTFDVTITLLESDGTV